MEERILRCDGCQGLVHTDKLRRLGCCHHCGNRKYKSVQILRPDEEEKLRNRSYDFALDPWPEGVEEFLSLFERVEEED